MAKCNQVGIGTMVEFCSMVWYWINCFVNGKWIVVVWYWDNGIDSAVGI